MRGRPAVARERGFVLVGVVMFVLALTILGLSLYGLSSYEGQFLTDTQCEEQAVMRAEGGIEMVQALISMPPYRLSQAKLAEGKEGIAYAKAWQVWNSANDSTKVMNWSDSVYVVVGANVNGVRRSVSGIYRPTFHLNPYKRLIATPTPIFYNTTDKDGFSRIGSTTFRGSVWQTVAAPADTVWTSCVSWPSGRPMVTEPAPTPNLTAFLSQYYATATIASYPVSDNSDNRIVLDAGSSSALKYFRCPATSNYSKNYDHWMDYDFVVHPKLEIRVRGTAVWMVQAGMRFNNEVSVVAIGSEPANLIIVTGPNGRHIEGAGGGPDDYRNVGLWCFGLGRISATENVRVFLVSSGMVRIEKFASGSGGGGGGEGRPNGGGAGTDPPGGGSGAGAYDIAFPFLNIFAQSLWLMGPLPAKGTMRLTYSSTASEATMMDALVDDLLSRGALPPVPGAAGGAFTLLPGSWRQP